MGVLSALVGFYNALLADPEIPTLRVLLDQSDVEHAMVAAILHDLGQVGFGHDLEAACPNLFRHEALVSRLLDEKCWGGRTLREELAKSWPSVKCERVLNILSKKTKAVLIDGVAHDIVDGPIDADKFDYIQRDSRACNVPYGQWIDSPRFFQALAVDVALTSQGGCRINLAYKAKGLAAIEALLLARYQMYSAVYWQHTFRCVQAMYAHAVAATFGAAKPKAGARGVVIDDKIMAELIYHWLVCGKSIPATKKAMLASKITCPAELDAECPAILGGERALELVWKFADAGCQELLERLAARKLYKRVFELKMSELGDNGKYADLKGQFTSQNRIDMAGKIDKSFLDAINTAIQNRGPQTTDTEAAAREQLQKVAGDKRAHPRIVVDLPTRGVPDETNIPSEIGDPSRKYTSGNKSGRGEVFSVVRNLQVQRATLRVFASPELHELIIRYLDPGAVESCMKDCIPTLSCMA